MNLIYKKRKIPEAEVLDWTDFNAADHCGIWFPWFQVPL